MTDETLEAVETPQKDKDAEREAAAASFRAGRPVRPPKPPAPERAEPKPEPEPKSEPGAEAPDSEAKTETKPKPRSRAKPRTATRKEAARPVKAEEEPAEAEPDEAGESGTSAESAVPRRRSSSSSSSRGGRGRGGKPKKETKTETGDATGREDGKAPDAETPATAEPTDAAGEDEDAAPKTTARRRRRRGGRGRGGKPKSPAGEEGDEAEPGETESAEPESPKPARTRSRRKPAEEKTSEGEKKAGAGRSAARRKPAAAKVKTRAKASEDGEKPAATRARPRTRRKAGEGATKEASSTRLRSRTRVSSRRRRVELPVFKRTYDKTMVITEHGERDQIAVLEGRDLVEHYITRAGAHSMVGNIYMARVQNVLPGMEAAFLDVGRGRNAVLYAGEVNYDEDVEGEAPRIEKALKNGQAVMVQVTKDPLGSKGARLTAQVSLPGRYLVLVPDSGVFGISRRLPDEERTRLRAAVKKVRPDEHGVIVRTAAEGASEEELAADVERLIKEWAQIEKKSKKVKAPAGLYEEPELTVRVVRDLFNAEEFIEIATDSPRIYERITEYLAEIAPDLVGKVRLHEGSLPVFEEFHVVEQIHKALDRKVWLPSGGYLVIERTEALTVIDVNTGKHVGKTNLEETVVQTNVEAAEEVARQLRLRDIGGMIIVDFIDMIHERNKRKVVETVRDALAQDKTRSQVFDVSPLGLLEITRKRVSAGLLESFSETCPTCEGRGILLTLEI